MYLLLQLPVLLPLQYELHYGFHQRQAGLGLLVCCPLQNNSPHDPVVPAKRDNGAAACIQGIRGRLVKGTHTARRSPAIKSEILTAGDLTFDRGRCTVKSRSGEIRLSGKETLLIDIFLSNPGQVVSRETIQARVWGSDSQSTYNSIEVYLTLLRRKLRSIGSEAQICAERGLGYYLAE